MISTKIIMAQTETQPYEIIKKIEDGEIRYYPPIMVAEHKSKNPGSGFGKLLIIYQETIMQIPKLQ